MARVSGCQVGEGGAQGESRSLAGVLRCVGVWRRPQISPCLPARGEGKEADQKLRAGAGQPSQGPSLQGSPHSPRKAGDRAKLGSVFPEARTGARVSGLLRQRPKLDKGRGSDRSPRSCSAHPYCLLGHGHHL